MMRTFDKSLVVSLVPVVALMAMIVGIAYRNIQQLHDHSNRMAHTHAVLDALDRVVSAVTDTETGTQGFLIAGERAHLGPYNVAVAAMDQELKYLGQLTQDDPSQQASFSKLQLLIAKRGRQFEHAIELRTDQGFNAAQAFVNTNQGRRTMNSIREVARKMRDLEQERLERRAQAAERSYETAIVTELLTGLLGLGMVGAFILLLRRHLVARSKAAVTLREEKEWFSTTLASIGDAVIATDTAARVTFLNAVAESLTGWSQREAAGQSLDKVFYVVDEASRTMIENPALQALRAGVAVGLANHTVLVAKDGVERPIADSAAPIRDKHKGIVGTVLVFRDITERKRAQEALKFLAESGVILSSSLNYDATLKNVARLAVNVLADYCFFDLLTNGGEIKRVAWAHRDPEKQSAMSDIWRFVPRKASESDPVIKTLTTGQTQFAPPCGRMVARGGDQPRALPVHAGNEMLLVDDGACDRQRPHARRADLCSLYGGRAPLHRRGPETGRGVGTARRTCRAKRDLAPGA
jgi:PAS domain S-box-containing protein